MPSATRPQGAARPLSAALFIVCGIASIPVLVTWLVVGMARAALGFCAEALGVRLLTQSNADGLGLHFSVWNLTRGRVQLVDEDVYHTTRKLLSSPEIKKSWISTLETLIIVSGLLTTSSYQALYSGYFDATDDQEVSADVMSAWFRIANAVSFLASTATIILCALLVLAFNKYVTRDGGAEFTPGSRALVCVTYRMAVQSFFASLVAALVAVGFAGFAFFTRSGSGSGAKAWVQSIVVWGVLLVAIVFIVVGTLVNHVHVVESEDKTTAASSSNQAAHGTATTADTPLAPESKVVGCCARLAGALNRALWVPVTKETGHLLPTTTHAAEQAKRPPPFRLDVVNELVHDIMLKAQPYDFDGFNLGVSDRAPRGILQKQQAVKEECCRALQAHLPAALPNALFPPGWAIDPETDAQLVWDESTNVCAAVHVHVRFGSFATARAVAEVFESPQQVRTVPAGAAAPAAAGAVAVASAALAVAVAPAAPPAAAATPPQAAPAAAAMAGGAAKTLLVSAHITPGSELCSWIAAERNVITVTPSYNLTADAMKRLLLYNGRDRWLSDVVRVTYRTVDDVFVAEVTTGTQLVESIPHKLKMQPGIDLQPWVDPSLRGYVPKLAPVWEFELTSLYR